MFICPCIWKGLGVGLDRGTAPGGHGSKDPPASRDLRRDDILQHPARCAAAKPLGEERENTDRCRAAKRYLDTGICEQNRSSSRPGGMSGQPSALGTVAGATVLHARAGSERGEALTELLQRRSPDVPHRYARPRSHLSLAWTGRERVVRASCFRALSPGIESGGGTNKLSPGAHKSSWSGASILTLEPDGPSTLLLENTTRAITRCIWARPLSCLVNEACSALDEISSLLAMSAAARIISSKDDDSSLILIPPERRSIQVPGWSDGKEGTMGWWRERRSKSQAVDEKKRLRLHILLSFLHLSAETPVVVRDADHIFHDGVLVALISQLGPHERRQVLQHRLVPALDDLQIGQRLFLGPQPPGGSGARAEVDRALVGSGVVPRRRWESCRCGPVLMLRDPHRLIADRLRRVVGGDYRRVDVEARTPIAALAEVGLDVNPKRPAQNLESSQCVCNLTLIARNFSRLLVGANLRLCDVAAAQPLWSKPLNRYYHFQTKTIHNTTTDVQHMCLE
ncbi:hypothetical protein EYF80_007134 [Liparis tanakae]|uniref:Uncharacterized protein n=1 Tax=Liparis tanakae TaxID=230148 RepID=A0A4Z2IXK7_9TELE|nr:hypothetical protein EYF80_007134 [Liparis tanakae]